jgi:hypothetical protein
MATSTIDKTIKTEEQEVCPNMGKRWTQEIMMEYPKKWVVVVNIIYNESDRKNMGEVYRVVDTEDEAYDVYRSLGKSKGDTMVIEGFNDTPQVSSVFAS